MNELPCGLIGLDCSDCQEEECTALDSGFGGKQKYDAMGKVSIKFDCITEIEQNVLFELDDPLDYYWIFDIPKDQIREVFNGALSEYCTPGQADVIRLRYQWHKERAVQLTFDEIGELLGITAEGARQRFLSGIKSLKEALSKKEPYNDEAA